VVKVHKIAHAVFILFSCHLHSIKFNAASLSRGLPSRCVQMPFIRDGPNTKEAVANRGLEASSVPVRSRWGALVLAGLGLARSSS
jgi:hypothetical protein